MKTLKLIITSACFFLVCAFSLAKVIAWKVKEKEYSVKAECCGPDGASFKGLKANLSFDEEQPERSAISATIDAANVSTGNANTDREVQEALHADLHPYIIFRSYAIKRTTQNYMYEVNGKLTLNGITKEITFPFTFDSQKDHTEKFPFKFKQTFEGTMSITSKDFGIQKGPGLLNIHLSIPVEK